MDKIAVIDCRAEKKTIDTLESVGLRVIPTAKTALYDSIATHADIQIHYLGNNRFICAGEVFSHYSKLLGSDFELIKGSAPLGTDYPHDIPYNAAALRNFLICNTRYTATEILSEYKSMSKKILSVKQGYSKCSICTLSDNAIITSDAGIAKKAYENGIDTLKIKEGFIKLRGLDYGFIGGATGLTEKNVLAVNGDINTHPNAVEIQRFLKKHNTRILKLKDGFLEDIGSVIVNLQV